MELKTAGILALIFSGSLLLSDNYSVDTVFRKPAETASASIKMPAPAVKYVYAEMVYQVEYKKIRQWVSGKSVTADLKKKVSDSKYSDEALDILGEDGWELVGTATRNFTNGFEIMFYMKKTVL